MTTPTTPTITFPSTHSPDDWIPVVMTGLRHLGADKEPVRMSDLCDWLATLPTFPAGGWDSWGMMPTKGYPLGKRAVTLAATKLRDEGVIETPKRGYYKLTDNGSSTTEIPDVEPTVPTETPETPETTPVAVVNVDGVAWVPPSLAPNERAAPYMGDMALRKMAINRSRCFGAWSDRSSACNGCPLAHLCAEASVVDLAEVAADLDRQTEAEIAEIAKAAKAAKAAPVPPEAPKAEVAGDWPVIPAPFEVLCSSCGEPIKAGEDAAHIPQGSGRPGGIYHPVCASLLL